MIMTMNKLIFVTIKLLWNGGMDQSYVDMVTDIHVTHFDIGENIPGLDVPISNLHVLWVLNRIPLTIEYAFKKNQPVTGCEVIDFDDDLTKLRKDDPLHL